MIVAMHERLQAWAEWARGHAPRRGPAGFAAQSSEYRIMRTAPGDVTLRDLPRVWLCADCRYRNVKMRRPDRCFRCGGRQIALATNVAHGQEATPVPAERIPLESDPAAESLDLAIARMGQDHPHLRDVVVIRYLRGYALQLTAEYLGVTRGKVDHWTSCAHFWLDGHLAPRRPTSA